MITNISKYLLTTLIIISFASPGILNAHGDVTPQAVDVESLPKLGEDWKSENPYRHGSVDDKVWYEALRVGSSAYNQNCARCHGIEAISGGLAPDLRYLQVNLDSDEWYTERIVNGATLNGITRMPGFGEVFSQEAAWAIRTYIETRPAEGALDEFAPRLREIRDRIEVISKEDDGKNKYKDELGSIREELYKIADKIPTGSGADKSDSIALRAGNELSKENYELNEVRVILTVGLSEAK